MIDDCAFCHAVMQPNCVWIAGYPWLIVPRAKTKLVLPASVHVRNLAELPDGCIGHMMTVVHTAMAELGHVTYQLQVNQGRFQHVPHFHINVTTLGYAIPNHPKK